MILEYAKFVLMYALVILLGALLFGAVWEFIRAARKFDGGRALKALAVFVITYYLSSFIMPVFLTTYVRIIQL